jgi:hypothetical protein
MIARMASWCEVFDTAIFQEWKLMTPELWKCGLREAAQTLPASLIIIFGS